MKRLIAVATLILSFIMSYVCAFADESIPVDGLVIEKGRLSHNDEVQEIIDDYFTMRKQLFLYGEKTIQTSTRYSDACSPELLENELSRVGIKDAFASNHNVYVIDLNVTPTVLGVVPYSTFRGLCYNVVVYEWNWVTYDDGQGGPEDQMGYATVHYLTIENDPIKGYRITEDKYDESDLLGTKPEEGLFQEKEDVNENLDAHENYIRNTQTYSNYNVNAAIEYADTFVAKAYAADDNVHPGSYNASVYGYYTGGDCANFVSQCLHAGGMPFDYGSGKNYNDWTGTQWWYDSTVGNLIDNYTACPPGWRYVPEFIHYWTNEGYQNVAATSSNVYPGSPVLSGTNHVTICVGYNHQGTPIVNGHTRDVYHIPYTMIGSNRTTILLNGWNVMSNSPANATVITPTSTNQTLLRYLSPNCNNYFKITVTSTSYYTFESSYYSNTALDTRAYLYRESTSSNGATLYMYEITRDDDSGTNYNFKIHISLTPGTYYLRVRACNPSVTGNYYLNYKKG